MLRVVLEFYLATKVERFILLSSSPDLLPYLNLSYYSAFALHFCWKLCDQASINIPSTVNKREKSKRYLERTCSC